MSNLPFVSVLIPVYNVESYIARCIRSVMEQTYSGKMECVIVDDCGTDNSVTIARQLIGSYQGSIDFLILRHEHNKGLAGARNTAVAAARGDFIIHVDSDDWIEPSMVDKLVKKQIDSNSDIVSCNAIVHFAERTELLVEPDYASKEEMMHGVLQMTLDHVIWRRLIRASLYKDNHITAFEGVNIGEDHYTVPRLLYYANLFAKYDEALYHYNCMNTQSYTSEQVFNPIRTGSDVASLNILIDFFGKNNPAYLDELFAMKSRYIYDRFFVILKTRNKSMYEKLCLEWQSLDGKYKMMLGLSSCRIQLLSSSHYHLNRLRVFGRVLIKRVFGIKCYHL